jgi:hypothetical protein
MNPIAKYLSANLSRRDAAHLGCVLIDTEAGGEPASMSTTGVITTKVKAGRVQ